MPCDEPLRVSQGVLLRESEYHGFAKFGAIQGHDGSTPVGRLKGNRSALDVLPRENDLGLFARITGGKRG